jgi:hypothetical protein
MAARQALRCTRSAGWVRQRGAPAGKPALGFRFDYVIVLFERPMSNIDSLMSPGTHSWFKMALAARSPKAARRLPSDRSANAAVPNQ